MCKSIPSRAFLLELLVGGLCVSGALAVTLPHSPANMSYVWPDGGVFLYVGQRILEGAVPYRDVWDHKPPLVYYLNALGLLVAPGSRWGVWAIEFLAVTLATWLSVRVLRRAFGTAIALLTTAIWLTTFFAIIEDGNLTETYAMPLQFACLALAYDVETKRAGVYRWRGFFIGTLLGLIFFLKLNQIGIGIAIGAYLLLRAVPTRAWRRVFTDLLWIAGGFALVTVIVVGYFAAQNSLPDMFGAVLIFNFIYSGQLDFWSGRSDALAAGYTYLSGSGLALFALLGLVIGLNVLLFARERIPEQLRPLLGICALAMPIEVVLVMATGRPFDHYFAALLYVLAVWAGYFFHVLFRSVDTWLAPAPARASRIAKMSLGIVILLTLLPALKRNLEWAQTLHRLEPPAVVRFLRERTAPGDTVLVLGHEARILFFAGRRAPTRFVNTSTFQQTAFVTPEMAQEYYKDILDAAPAYIVDVRGQGLVNVTPIDSQYIRRRVGALNQQYRKFGDVGGWIVYERARTP